MEEKLADTKTELANTKKELKKTTVERDRALEDRYLRTQASTFKELFSIFSETDSSANEKGNPHVTDADLDEFVGQVKELPDAKKAELQAENQMAKHDRMLAGACAFGAENEMLDELEAVTEEPLTLEEESRTHRGVQPVPHTEHIASPPGVAAEGYTLYAAPAGTSYDDSFSTKLPCAANKQKKTKSNVPNDPGHKPFDTKDLNLRIAKGGPSYAAAMKKKPAGSDAFTFTRAPIKAEGEEEPKLPRSLHREFTVAQAAFHGKGKKGLQLIAKKAMDQHNNKNKRK
jgi:hypothetical protein